MQVGHHYTEYTCTLDTCSDTGCVPYCVPGRSETCVKYTEWTGKHMSYTSAVMINIHKS